MCSQVLEGLDLSGEFDGQPARGIEQRALQLGAAHLAVGGEAFGRSMSVMRPYARLISIGAHAGEIVPFDIIEFFRRHIAYVSSHTQTSDGLIQVLRLIAGGRLSPRVHSTHPLRDAADAHRELAERTNYGKILLAVG